MAASLITQLEGTIARRILLNYWLDAEVARRLVPEQFEIVTRNGFAVAGICLIRLEQMRPQGLPAAMGIASENMAHRVAVRYREGGVMREGVYIWRRDTDSLLAARLGGLLFPGVQRDAEFRVSETELGVGLRVLTADGAADVTLNADFGADWKWTLLFPRFTDVSDFFARGDCGFSCALRSEALEGMRVESLRWEMAPVAIRNLHAAFFENEAMFPRGSVGFDSAVVMRGIPSRWHALHRVPELTNVTDFAGAASGGAR